MTKTRTALRVVLALLLVVFPLPIAGSEVQPAVLEGTIADPSGESLPGVWVELTGSALAGPRNVVTDGAGHFKFPGLPAGTYTITASMSGFQRAISTVVLAEGAFVKVSLTLPLSPVTEAVIVTAEAPVVSSSSQMSSTYSSEESRKLPAPRSSSSVPGTKRGASETGKAQGSGQIAHGATISENRFVIDGVDTTGTKPAGRPALVPANRDPLDRAFAPLPVPSPKVFPDMFFRSFGVNPTVETEEEAVSTFAVSVDTASYTLARSYLDRDALPDADGVRVEEFVNYFDYRYAPPRDGAPFSVHAEAFPSPNRKGYHVLHVGLKGRVVDTDERKPVLLVFCVDVSGSMGIENRLGLVKRALRLLVNELDGRDRVGIVVYGTTARVLLEPMPAVEKGRLLAAVEELRPEGTTNAQAGIREAYRLAGRHARQGEISRVVLCTDGVANNGVTDADGIFADVKSEAERGINVTAVGFGMGNYNDVLLERLARIGHGQYAYVDRLEEARRIFVTQLGGTLQTIAKDVKIQVEFDATTVARYRLLGFESRALANEEFDDDRVDGGNIGAGHAVTAVYEVKFRGFPSRLGTLRIRYKEPEGESSRLLEKSLGRSIVRASMAAASSPARLSFVAAAFAEKLRGSYWVRNLSYGELIAAWEGLGASVRARSEVAELRGLLLAAKRTDRREDRFEQLAPLAGMDFDRVPVLQ